MEKESSSGSGKREQPQAHRSPEDTETIDEVLRLRAVARVAYHMLRGAQASPRDEGSK